MIKPPPKVGTMLNIDLYGHEDVRWKLRQIALEERITLRALVVRILSDWLSTHGNPLRPDSQTLHERES